MGFARHSIRMLRKAYITGAVALAVVLPALHTPVCCRVVSSARSFQHYFQDLKSASSISPLERIVFSLVLAETHKDGAAADRVAPSTNPADQARR